MFLGFEIKTNRGAFGKKQQKLHKTLNKAKYYKLSGTKNEEGL